MNELFLQVVNRSICASWLVMVILLVRAVWKRAPKWGNVLLWGIVALRLICPFSVESAWSLIPSVETIPMNIEMEPMPAVDTGVNAINTVLNPVISGSFAPDPAVSANPLQIWIPLTAGLWIAGMAGMLLYTAIRYGCLRRRIDTAVLWKDNIFQSENVASPFVMGIRTPRIYLPFGLNGEDSKYVVAHEQAHIRRKDHWWKPLGFLLLTIHWFNPLMWLAYVLFCRDVELACDEKVIGSLDSRQRADYTQALLACSVRQPGLAACPLAFGEVGVKKRVRSVMNYRKPAFWTILLAITVCAVVAVCFLTNPKKNSFQLEIVIPPGSRNAVVYADEEISPTGNFIVITSGQGLGDTEVYLKPVAVKTETAYDEPGYLTPGSSVKMQAEKGGWFRIGVNIQNDTNQEMVVQLNVKNVEVRIPASSGVDLEQYRTDYIGEAPKVSGIAQGLAYPEGYSYSSIALQTDVEPYELIVYLHGDGTARQEDFESSAATAFDLIGNMGILSFRNAETEETIASFTRTHSGESRKFFLTIGAEGVTGIEIAMPYSSGGCRNADGTPFKKGEQVWLEPLDAYSELRGLKITALNQAGETVWFASVSDSEENKGVTDLTQNGWAITSVEARD